MLRNKQYLMKRENDFPKSTIFGIFPLQKGELIVSSSELRASGHDCSNEGPQPSLRGAKRTMKTFQNLLPRN